MGIAAFAVVMMAAAQAAAQQPPTPAPELAVSVERVREALHRPELKIPPIDSTPVFRESIEEKQFDNPLQGMRRALAEDPGGHAGSGFDVLPLVMGVVKSVEAAYRAHAEAEIRKEVQAALIAFCAEHDCSMLEDGPTPLEGVLLPRAQRAPHP
jgi:hypothetical protein